MNTQDEFLVSAVKSAGAFGSVIQMLIDGVAFRQDGQLFNVFSHEGDDIGQLSTADVNFAIHFMRRLGREVGKCEHPTFVPMVEGTIEPAFTFAWIGWFDWNTTKMAA